MQRLAALFAALLMFGPMVAVGTCTTLGQTPIQLARAPEVVESAQATPAKTTVPPVKAPPAPAGPSPEVLAYGKYIGPKFQVIGQALETTQTLLGRLSAQPTLLRDQKWRDGFIVTMSFLRSNAEQMQQYPSPPPSVAALDETVKGLGRDLILFVDELANGLDNLDPRKIESATSRLRDVGPRADRVSKQFDAAVGR